MDKSVRFWELIANSYDRQTMKFQRMYVQAIENTKKYLCSNDIVLDFGCGTGTTTIEMAEYVKEIIGIDISAKMIAAAKAKANERKLVNAIFLQKTLFDSEFKCNSFDTILVLNILHCFKDTKKVIDRIYELLKPGGLLVSVTPCISERNILTRISIAIPIFLLNTLRIFSNDVKFFSFTRLEKAISSNLFRILETKDFITTEKHYFIAARKI
jgi:2-polyprenyl-3-methyl-5-hydroxy-6-metoxy-1,4-benzoquinol methylase